MSAVEGDSSSTIIIGTLIDPDPGASPDDYLGTQIQWGDNTPSSDAQFVPTNTDQQGNPITQGSAFLVEAQHTYAEEGTPTASTTIQDDGGSSAPGSTQVTVADSQLNAQGVDVSATSGVPFSGTVATFNDTDPGASSSSGGSYRATIDWGDGSGTDTTAKVVSDGNGGWLVQGSHTYLDQGNYAMTVLMADAGGAKASTQPAAGVLNPTILVNGVATTQLSLYQSQTSKVDVTVLDPTNNNKPLGGWIVLRTDNHQNLVNDNLATNGAPPTDADGKTTVTLTAGKVKDAQNPVSVSFTAKSPNFRQPNNPNTATVNVTVKPVSWKISNSFPRAGAAMEVQAFLDTNQGKGGGTLTATITAIDPGTGKAVTGVALVVTSTVGNTNDASIDSTQKTTDPNTGTVQFTLKSKAGIHLGFAIQDFNWAFADATGSDLYKSINSYSDDINVQLR